MKSVLIIDTPVNCDECDLCYLKSEDKWYCPMVGFMDRAMMQERHSSCPLKPLPEKMPCNYYTAEGFNNGYDKGWNDYRDHLTGEWNHYKPEKYGELHGNKG